MSDKKEKKPRALSAYNFFMKEKRQEILDKDPDTKRTDIMKIVAEMWKNTDDEGKAKYQKLAEEDKKRVAELRQNEPATKKTKSKKKQESDSGDDGDDE